MMTSRAEFRLLLREDNTVDRLLPIGRALGLVGDERWREFEAWRAELAAALRARASRASSPAPTAVNDALARFGCAPISGRRATLAELLRRPELDWRAVEQIAAAGGVAASEAAPSRARAHRDRDRRTRATSAARRPTPRGSRAPTRCASPTSSTIATSPGCRTRSIEKLEAIRPRSVGQASRISGVTPAAIAILLTHIGLVAASQAAAMS